MPERPLLEVYRSDQETPFIEVFGGGDVEEDVEMDEEEEQALIDQDREEEAERLRNEQSDREAEEDYLNDLARKKAEKEYDEYLRDKAQSDMEDSEYNWWEVEQ